MTKLIAAVIFLFFTNNVVRRRGTIEIYSFSILSTYEIVLIFLSEWIFVLARVTETSSLLLRIFVCSVVLQIMKQVIREYIILKIILPHKLRYLENMLNAEVVAKAAKIRQRLEANPNTPDSEKSWPVLLAQYQDDKKQTYAHNSFYIRRPPNL